MNNLQLAYKKWETDVVKTKERYEKVYNIVQELGWLDKIIGVDLDGYFFITFFGITKKEFIKGVMKYGARSWQEDQFRLEYAEESNLYVVWGLTLSVSE